MNMNTETKTFAVNFKLTAEEAAIVSNAAAALDCSATQAIRFLITESKNNIATLYRSYLLRERARIDALLEEKKGA